MRLAVSIAAWSSDADATLPPDPTLHTRLPAALQDLGFSSLHLPLAALPLGLTAALAGLEPTDTLLVHVSGVLGPEGSIELGDLNEGGEPDFVPLRVVADALARRPCGRALVIVEAGYRGDHDALRAVEYVESVADALSSNAGAHTTVIAAHPASTDVARLCFTHAMLEAAREVGHSDGTAVVADAYERARERQIASLAASGLALLSGASPFPMAHGLAVGSGAPLSLAPPGAASSSAAASSRAPASSLPPPPSVTPASLPAASDPVLVAAAARFRIESVPAFTPLVPADAIGRSTTTLRDPAPPSSAAAVTLPIFPVPATAASAPDWLEGSDVVEAFPPEPLEKRIAVATAAGDYPALVRLYRERLSLLATPEARVDELFEIGRMLVAKLHDLPEAVITLEEARGIDASREDVLEALRRAYGRLSRWTEALEVTLALVKRTEQAHDRAGFRVAAALLACQHLADDDYAVELLAAALEDDPANEEALGELVRIRRSRGDLVDLEHTLAALADRLVLVGDAPRAWDACQRLASLRRDDLGDAAGAVEALAIAKRLPLSELESRAVLAEQLLALGDDEGAVLELESMVSSDPAHVRAHARLLSVHRRVGNSDRAYLSALALEELGEADANAREMLEAYRAEWGLRARVALDDTAWQMLRAEGSDEVIEAVFRASFRAAIAAQFEDQGRPSLDPSRRQPETSTASIVRCFHWAARALGSPSPALYVLDDVAGGIAAVPSSEPTTAFGPDVLRGLSAKTLAFLAGRHLTYFRPEYRALVHFPTAEAAAGLFFAAVELVAPGTFVPTNLEPRVATTKRRLARHLRPEELASISAAVGRLEARNGPVDLVGWIHSVELTAGRAGLLLAGDLQTALTQARSEPRGLSGLGLDPRRADLLSFCASRALADLRAIYADTTPSSMRPPTTESAVVHKDDRTLRESGEVVSARARRLA